MKKILLFIILFFSSVTLVKASNVVDVTSLSMEELVDYLDKGIISSEKLVSIYLERINTFNSEYNALITINNNIIEEAKYSDNLRKEGKKRGLLEGIPIIVKDNIDVVGMPTTGGAKALEDNYPIEDADVIKKIKEAGGIIIGKANMSLFALSAIKSCSSYGCVNNPLNKEYTTYGSSGGSAAGVRLDLAPIALGTDTNSSVRLPADATGLIGLRPSTSIISNKGIINYDITRDTVGIIAKNVNDTKILYSVISDNIKEEATYNIGIPSKFINNYFLKNELDSLIEKLKNNNINIIYIDDISTSKIDRYSYRSLAGFTMCKAFNEYIKGTNSSIKSFKQLANKVSSISSYTKFCNYNDSDLEKSIKYQNKLKEYMDEVYNKYNIDYLLFPSTNNELFLNGEDKLNNKYSKIAASIGNPSITIPFIKYNNFYYSIELMGKRNKDSNLLELASNIENIIDIEDCNSTNLYTISIEDTNLVNLYLDNYDNSDKKEWLSKVREYFINDIGDSKSLLEEFDKKEENETIVESREIKVYNEQPRESKDSFSLTGILFLLCCLLPFYWKFRNKRMER